MKKITVLGNGQVWDLRGVDPKRPQAIFEDLFCGRVLEEKAALRRKVFSGYIEKEKTRITGMSVTLALRDKKNRNAREEAARILKEVAHYAGRGILVLTRGQGHKPGWSQKDIALWKNLSGVIIGGGVSRGRTGSLIIAEIKDYLDKEGLGTIEVTRAKFPGKESGFMGAIVNVLDKACREGREKKLAKIGVIGIDLGRDKIGVGILVVNPRTCGIITFKVFPWVYRYSVRTIRSNNRIKQFERQRSLGEELRSGIIAQITRLIIRAMAQAEKAGISCSRHIGLALPGETTPDGYLIGSTDYLPFFTKKDGFHFSKAVEEDLAGSGSSGVRLHIINDGIAAGLANLKIGLGLESLKAGKYAFLGPGSGLGGCLCRVEEVK